VAGLELAGDGASQSRLCELYDNGDRNARDYGPDEGGRWLREVSAGNHEGVGGCCCCGTILGFEGGSIWTLEI
jgi:hypothetical protein